MHRGGRCLLVADQPHIPDCYRGIRYHRNVYPSPADTPRVLLPVLQLNYAYAHGLPLSTLHAALWIVRGASFELVLSPCVLYFLGLSFVIVMFLAADFLTACAVTTAIAPS